MSSNDKNFFDLCNEVLDELYYEQVDTFEELDDTTEGRKVKKLLNRALITVCNNENSNWQFRETNSAIILVEGQSEYERPNGFIRYIKRNDENLVLTYVEEHKDYPDDTTGDPVQYWMDNERIRFFPIPSETGKQLNVHLYTNDYAKDCNGILKQEMECECDTPIIPNKHRNILVYRVCADWRANDADAKSQYYDRKYREAYRAMKMDCVQSEDYPSGLDITHSNPSIVKSLYNGWNISTQTSKGNM